MLKVILAGGGTGGHIYPAIAIASEFKYRFPDSEILFIGTRKGLEKELVPKNNFKLEFISAKGLARSLRKELFFLPFYILKSLLESRTVLRKYQPDIVIGTGGYVSLPVLLMASLMGKKTLIQEQNSYPGISTRILSLFANRVCLSYQDSARYFPLKRNLRVLGNPIRKEIVSGNREEGLRKFNLNPDKKTVFILGGSQGSKGINQAIREGISYLEQAKDIQLLWQTGSVDFEMIRDFMKGVNVTSTVLPFIQDMSSAYAVADLIVCRSGALTLAEVTACGKPSILIPYPFATADHQRYNAMSLKEKGAAEVILEKELKGENLAGMMIGLLKDENRLKEMSENAKILAKPMAASQIVDEMEELLKK
ncbi:MAG: undecaprenyldiphospho-muramoylpentapeptide beta-N-acetylglucosaminyltransferase [candidate division Zixibacteria bacterium]|nr:undecaprenyldiphospho-muramoylpentapeptide beta-N-acetylglucosaminyltransferase [candidate division Zixibacteria bacterium]